MTKIHSLHAKLSAIQYIQSTPVITDTLGTAIWCPEKRESVIAGCEKIFILNRIYRRGSHVCSFSLSPVPFSDPSSGASKERQNRTNRTGVTCSGSSKYVYVKKKQSSYVAAEICGKRI